VISEVYLTWQLLYTFGKDVIKDFRDIFATFSSVSEGTDTTPNRFAIIPRVSLY